MEIIFNNYDEAVKSIEKKWTRQKTHSTKSGIKEYYKCAINSKCPARMQLHCIDENQNVNMLRNQEEHDHGFINTAKRLRKEIKEKIIQLFDIKVTAPLNIIYTLRKEGFKNLPDQKQISNFLSRHRKKTKGESTISYKQFKDWCISHSSIPNESNRAFVVKYDINSENKTNQYIRVLISTKYLLELATKNPNFACTDGTYKLIYQGHPVLLIGHVDKARQFHPIGVSITTKEKNEDFCFIFQSIQVNLHLINQLKIT